MEGQLAWHSRAFARLVCVCALIMASATDQTKLSDRMIESVFTVIHAPSLNSTPAFSMYTHSPPPVTVVGRLLRRYPGLTDPVALVRVVRVRRSDGRPSR